MAEGENSEKGNGITPYKRTYCARCDLFFAPSENEKISLMAKQIDITVSYELATIGEECLADSCSAEDQDSSKYKVLGVDTAEFVPAGLNVEIGM